MKLQHPKKAGLQNAMLYMRAEAVKLWKKLDDAALKDGSCNFWISWNRKFIHSMGMGLLAGIDVIWLKHYAYRFDVNFNKNGNRCLRVREKDMQGFSVKDCDDHVYDYDEYTMPSWTLQNYEDACSNDTFYNDIKSTLSCDKNAISSKFELYGFSGEG